MALLMTREGLPANARYADAALHGDGTASLQGEAFQPAGPIVLILKDPGVGAHNAASLETAVLSKFTLEVLS